MILRPSKHCRKIIFFVSQPVRIHKINEKSLLASHNSWFHVEHGHAGGVSHCNFLNQLNVVSLASPLEELSGSGHAEPIAPSWRSSE